VRGADRLRGGGGRGDGRSTRGSLAGCAHGRRSSRVCGRWPTPRASRSAGSGLPTRWSAARRRFASGSPGGRAPGADAGVARPALRSGHWVPEMVRSRGATSWRAGGRALGAGRSWSRARGARSGRAPGGAVRVRSGAGARRRGHPPGDLHALAPRAAAATRGFCTAPSTAGPGPGWWRGSRCWLRSSTRTRSSASQVRGSPSNGDWLKPRGALS
jgi:hypothetical protein